MDQEKIQSVATTLLQICITILPIGAGASSYSAQQEQSVPIFIAMGFVWLGLILLSLSAFFLLAVLRFSKGNALQISQNEKRFHGAITLFISGVVFLVLSPGGFAYHSLYSPSTVKVILPSNTLMLSNYTDAPVETVFNTVIEGLTPSEASDASVEAIVTDASCLSVTQEDEYKPAQIGDPWVITWKIKSDTICIPGNYVILFRLLDGNSLLNTNELFLSVTNEEYH